MKKARIASLLAAALIAAPAMTFAAAESSDNTALNKTYSSSDTFSCIGSVSKMFATTAVMQLVEQGKVELDAPVTDYLPDFRMADERYNRDLWALQQGISCCTTTGTQLLMILC